MCAMCMCILTVCVCHTLLWQIIISLKKKMLCNVRRIFMCNIQCYFSFVWLGVCVTYFYFNCMWLYFNCMWLYFNCMWLYVHATYFSMINTNKFALVQVSRLFELCVCVWHIFILIACDCVWKNVCLTNLSMINTNKFAQFCCCAM